MQCTYLTILNRAHEGMTSEGQNLEEWAGKGYLTDFMPVFAGFLNTVFGNVFVLGLPIVSTDDQL